jgi:predicted dehydrogenase/threonine dehydrogenase-like Zn-dependent dehydrogenase
VGAVKARIRVRVLFMKQLVQSMRQGTVDVLDVPTPQMRGPGVLVRTAASLISAGTERAALDFAKGSLLHKARSRPDLVKQVIQKVQRDGLLPTLDVAMARLDKQMAPGYACAGTVAAVSPELAGFTVGDPVACAGAGYATHAELNFIPKNLMVRIPKRPTGERVGFDEAAFTTLGAISLHGARLAQPQLGDRAVVIGLGAVGLLAVQILRAHGCRVAGVDLNRARCDLACALGADLAVPPSEAPASVAAWTGELGADLVLVAAAAAGSEPAVLAAELSRDKGRIVAIGATGLDLPRRLLYQKELSVVVSRSYGPGRYDPDYEEHGHDYPRPYVRWTERENMRAFLDLVADGSVDVRALISHRFPIAQAEQAYDALTRESVLGIILDYPQAHAGETAPGPVLLAQPAEARSVAAGSVAVSVIGTGNFARTVLLPAFARQDGVQLRGAVASTGLSARSAADKFGFAYCSTAASDVWNDAQCNAVVIATRHDKHAGLVLNALDAEKAVLVEKPLCLSETELDAITTTEQGLEAAGRRPFLMVGFNRRFAPATEFMRKHFARLQVPIAIIYRVNAGPVPHGSWVASPDEGGGRVLGEVCHFVDLCGYLTGSPITHVSAMRSAAAADEVLVHLRFSNGSVATIAYLVGGDAAAPKERIELLGGGAMGAIEDFRRATLSVNGRKSKMGGRLSRQDKGHAAEVRAFGRAVAEGAQSPVSFASAANSTRATFAILRSLECGAPVDVVSHSYS